MTPEKKEAIISLRNYKLSKKSMINLRERIELLQAKLEGMHSPGNTSCGTYHPKDETYCELIGKIDTIKSKLAELQRETRLVDNALDSLTAEEKQLLTGLYIDRYGITYVCDKLHLSQATAYRRTDIALSKYASVLGYMSADKTVRKK